MAKKKEYSFADEAKRIMKRFPRRETDPIEKRDYEEAMTRLQQEQEIARQEMGLGEPQQMAGGGKMKYPDGGKLYSDDRSSWDRFNDRVYGKWQANKPQLFKDYPITDFITPGLEYITGNTPDTGMQTGMP